MNQRPRLARKLIAIATLVALAGSSVANVKHVPASSLELDAPAPICAPREQSPGNQFVSDDPDCAVKATRLRFDWAAAARGLIDFFPGSDAHASEPALDAPLVAGAPDPDISLPPPFSEGLPSGTVAVVPAATVDVSGLQAKRLSATRFDNVLYPISAWLGLLALAAVLILGMHRWHVRTGG